jgi:hypothetical protein
MSITIGNQASVNINLFSSINVGSEYIITPLTGSTFPYTLGTFFDVFTQQSGVTSSIGISSNNGCWQMFYAHQQITIYSGSNNIGLVPFSSGNNSWLWYIASGSTTNSTASWSAVSQIAPSRPTSAYVGGQLTTSSINVTRTIPANTYFLIMNTGGPFYRTIRPLSESRVGTVNGSPYVTAINRVCIGQWPAGGTTTIPTQFGGSGTGYNEYTSSVHVMSIKFG